MKKILLAIIITISPLAHSFDHSHVSFDLILQKYLVETSSSQTLFKYKELKEQGSKSFNEYLASLSKVTLSKYGTFTNDQKLAFLINAYNAFTIKLIIDHYPVESIRDIGSVFTSAWKKKFFNFLGKKSYLDFIEHEMIRKHFKEPRIHFAVNCASMSCPSLMPFAFAAKNLDFQLDTAAKAFLGNTEKNQYDGSQKKLFLSKIFKWYGGDFEKVHGSVLKYVAPYIKTSAENRRLIGNEKVRLDYLDYDWNLNEQK